MILKSVQQEKEDKAKQLTNGQRYRYTLQLVKSITRSVIGVIVVCVGSYILISQIPVPREAWMIGAAIIGAIYGVDGILTYFEVRSRHSDRETKEMEDL